MTAGSGIAACEPPAANTNWAGTEGDGYHREMSEQDMVDAMNGALRDLSINDTIVAAGQFQPRGTSGAFMAGGLIGSSAGDALGGSVGGAIGDLAGVLAGAKAASEAQGLPEFMLVGVSESMVYGMKGRSRHQEPQEVIFAVERRGLRAVVHQRGMVRVLELIHDDGGPNHAAIELEGSRVPVTHSKDVIAMLTGREG